MCNRWLLLIVAGALLLTSCNQANDITDTPTSTHSATTTKHPTATATSKDIPTSTSQPTQTPEPTPAKAQALPPGESIRANLFGLVPPDSLSVGYCDFQQIREDPEIESAFEAVPDVCSDLFSIPEGRVDQLIAFGRKPDDSTRAMMGIIYILYGEFADVTLPELVQEFEFEDLILQESQGFEYMVEEQGEPFNSAVMIMNESTIVWGEESGILAVIDTALGLNSPPLGDLGAVLPHVLTASVLKNCPKYEDLGCTALVIHALAKGTGSDLLLLQVYQFEDPDSAANTLDTIITDIESGNSIQFGSMKIRGDSITQEGRFIIVEDFLPMEDIGKVFE
jgi:hypothetical protein